MIEQIIILITPEDETTPERLYWDRFIGALTALEVMSPEIDMIETMADMKDEDQEDAVNLLFSYYLNITTEVGESDELEAVKSFLEHCGILE